MRVGAAVAWNWLCGEGEEARPECCTSGAPADCFALHDAAFADAFCCRDAADAEARRVSDSTQGYNVASCFEGGSLRAAPTIME